MAGLAGASASGTYNAKKKAAGPNRLAFEMQGTNATTAFNPMKNPAATGNPDPNNWAGIAAGLAQTPGEDSTAAFGPSGGNNHGGGGPSSAAIHGAADELFAFNDSPYWQMQAAVNGQVDQANNYNPDFAGMEASYRGRLGDIDAQRAANVTSRLGEIGDFGARLGAQQGTQMQGALRDLGAQGVNPDRYLQQANAMGAERGQALGNQGQYAGQLNALGANTLAGNQASGAMIRQGGEATLANNRGTLLNQLQGQTAQIALQSAQAKQANEQARREFLLKYGVL